MEELLISTGLTKLQASAYLFLLENGESAPPSLTTQIKITRSNAYKVLENLEELGLATRTETKNKFTYRASDPSALSNLVAEKRNSVIALEQHVNAAMQELRAKYRKNTNTSTTLDYEEGKEAIKKSYLDHIKYDEPVYFIKSRSDISFMGFDTMNAIRSSAQTQNIQRYGITQDSIEAPLNPKLDSKLNLTRTWMSESSYTAPVEWSVSGNELLIQVFTNQGKVIKIQDSAVAEAFRQLWKLTDKALRESPEYKNLPLAAKRTN